MTREDVETGEPGELWFRTPQLMKGYLGKAEETAKVITEDGWFRTGDIGRMDEGGYVYVEDRLKDMIISGGENIYSPEVERVLSEHPAVAEVAVIGVPDDRWGEVVKAVVGPQAGRLGHRGRDHRVHPRAAREVQVPALGRHRGGTPPQPDRQDPTNIDRQLRMDRCTVFGHGLMELVDFSAGSKYQVHITETAVRANALLIAGRPRPRASPSRARSWIGRAGATSTTCGEGPGSCSPRRGPRRRRTGRPTWSPGGRS